MQCLRVMRLITIMTVSLYLVLTSGEFPVDNFQIKIEKKVEGFRFDFIIKVSLYQLIGRKLTLTEHGRPMELISFISLKYINFLLRSCVLGQYHCSVTQTSIH